MTAPDPRMQPALCGMRVRVGPRFEATLCHLVALVPRVGQVWHFIKPRHGYVLAVLDVQGHTRYSVIQDVAALLRHYKLPVANLGLDPAKLYTVIGIDWAAEGAESWQAGGEWVGHKNFPQTTPHAFYNPYGGTVCLNCNGARSAPLHTPGDVWQEGKGWEGPPPGANPLSTFADIVTTMGKSFGNKLPRHEFATSFGTEDCAICAMPEDHPIHDEDDD